MRSERHDHLWLGALALIGVIVLGVVLSTRFDTANLDNDTAQHISVATNLLEGRGLSTSLLFYDEHYAQDRLPAAQTIWPPGPALLIAALMLTGIGGVASVILIGAVVHLISGIVLYVIARTLDVKPMLAGVLGAMWIVTTTELGLVVRGYTEPLFVLCTLLSTLAFAKARTNPGIAARWLLAAGSFAALAFLVRYVGLAWIAALGAMAFAGSLYSTRRFSAALSESFFAGLIPGIAVVAVFARNWFITRTATGWPQVHLEYNVGGAVRAYFWSIQKALGGAQAVSDWAGAILELVLFLGVAMGVVLLFLRGGKAFRTWLPGARSQVVSLSVLYILASTLLLVGIASVRQADLLEWRYLVPLLPFGLLCIAILAQELLDSFAASVPFAKGVLVAGTVWVAAFLAGQGRATEVVLNNPWLENRAYILSAALDEPLGERTVRDRLRADTSNSSPVLSNESQGLGLLLDRPALGLSPQTYANKDWDEVAVREVVERYCVPWVVFYGELFDEDSFSNQNRRFFIELARGQIPDWLEHVTSARTAEIYRVRIPCPR